jgi:hypothetical protein
LKSQFSECLLKNQIKAIQFECYIIISVFPITSFFENSSPNRSTITIGLGFEIPDLDKSLKELQQRRREFGFILLY